MGGDKTEEEMVAEEAKESEGADNGLSGLEAAVEVMARFRL